MSQSSSAYVVEANEANFEAEVVSASMDTLVLVDLWAQWCGPCKTLGPILDAVATGYAGAIKVAKVDVDANPNLAAAFRAQSIPMVVAIYQGQPVDAFTGALPRQEVEAWIEKIFETVGIDASPVPEEAVPTDPVAASAYYQARLEANDDDQASRLGWGKLLMAQGHVDAAEGLLNAIPTLAPEYSAGQAALKLKALLSELGEAGGEAHWRARLAAAPDDADALYFVALADGAGGDFAGALTSLVTLVGSLHGDERARSLKSAQLLLGAAGRGDEGVEAQRRKLARLLF